MSIKKYRDKWSPNILWAFVIFFGFTFAIGNESQGSDITRYVAQYQSFYGHELTLDDSIEIFKKSEDADVMRVSLALLLSRFSSSSVVLTTVYALIFGFFYSRNIFYVF